MQRTLRAGVAGAGVFGGHHARKYAASEGVELVGVYDRGTGHALALAQQLGCPGFTDLNDFLGRLNVLTIAAPAVAHFGLASAAMDAGVDVYVEKPIGATVEEGRRLVEQASALGRVLACGHQERAVFAAMGLFEAPERPSRIEAVRRGTFTGRNMDVSVVLDLMIHDLDLALTLAGGEAKAIEAEGEASRGEFLDRTRAEITFADLHTVFEADRAAAARERTMRLVYPSGEVRIDFLERTFSNSTGFALDAGFDQSAAGRDPLGSSVAAFLAAVRGEQERPLVTGAEALRALELALEVEAAA